MLTLKNVCKSLGGKDVLMDVSFSLREGQKAALVGANGVGKSTLFRIIMREDTPDNGSVSLVDDVRVGYLPQEIQINEPGTIKEYLEKATGATKIGARMTELENDLTDPAKLEEYGDLQEKFLAMGGYELDHNMVVMMQGFGLDEVSPERPISSLSGGQKTKVALIALLLKRPNLILLDEPTNNLDLPSIVWLEKFLEGTDAACLIISHDRRFLDKIVSKVLEIDWFERTMSEHRGSYSDFLDFKEKEAQRQRSLYEAQEKEKDRLAASAEKSRQQAERSIRKDIPDKDKYSRGFFKDRSARISHKAKTLESRTGQMDEVKAPKERPELIIPLVPEESRAKHAISLAGVEISYLGGFRVGPIDLNVSYGSRIGIIGLNGSGKSTLLKAITGELEPAEGDVSVGPSLKVGNLMQAHENIPRDRTVMEVFKLYGINREQDVYHMLDRFQMKAEDAKKRADDLSPGERARIIFALFSLLSVNVLVLDEPTNHLDIEMLDALESVLGKFTGTVLFVSHDRYFLEAARPTGLFILEDGSLREITDQQQYLSGIERRAQESVSSLT